MNEFVNPSPTLTHEYAMASLRKKFGNVSGSIIPTNTLTNTGPSGFSGPVGAQEFRTVEGRLGYPPRRPRGRPRSHSHLRQMEEIDPISDCHNDELATEGHRLKIHGARPATQNGTWINPSRRVTDAADLQILRTTSQPLKGKKRKNPSLDIEDDELAEENRTTKTISKPSVISKPANNRLLGNSSTPRVDSRSISQKGTMARTNWKSPPSKKLKLRVVEAVCQQHYLLSDYHSSTSPNGEVFLQEAEGGNGLCAFRDDGNEAKGVSQWLKIGNKTQRIFYNEGSEIIKIAQSAEENNKIGPLMLLQFNNTSDAATLVSWVRRNLSGFVYISADSSKLTQIFNNTVEEVKKATRALTTLARDQESRVPGVSNELQRPVLSDGRPTSTSLHEPQIRDRGLYRDRMRDSRSNPEGPALQNLSDQTPSRPSAARSRPTAKSGDDTQPSKLSSSGPTSPYFSNRSPQPRTLRRPKQAIYETYSLDDEPEPEPEPPKWSELHPAWSKDWEMPLTLRRTTVDVQDIPRLDEGEFLNDNLVDFGLQYLFDKAGTRNPDLRKRVYIFNTFFYTKLKSLRGKQVNYDGVKSWTSRVDLFSYDYIIVPVNEKFHWWVAIICNARRLDPTSCNALPTADHSDKAAEKGPEDEPRSPAPDKAATGISQLSIDESQESNSRTSGEDGGQDKTVVDLVGEDTVMKDSGPANRTPDTTKQDETAETPFPKGCGPSDFKIITMDSLGSGHSPAVTALKMYLIQELRDKKNKEAEEPPGNIGMRATNIPTQNNYSDCGVYVLGYMKEFLNNPDKFVHTLLRKNKPDWTLDATEQRQEWRDTIFIEQKRQQDGAKNEKEAEEENRQPKRVKLTPPAPTDKKADQPEPSQEPVHPAVVTQEHAEGPKNADAITRAAPAAIEDASGVKKAKSPTNPLRPVRTTSPASRAKTSSPTPAEKKAAPVSIDLSSPVALEKKPDPRQASTHKTTSRPSTPTPPSKEKVEIPGTPSPKRSKKSPESTPATIGRPQLAPGPTTTTTTTPSKDDSFQEVSPTTFYKSENTRHHSHPPSSPPKFKEGISNPNRLRSQPPSSPPRPKSRGMADYGTLQTGISHPPHRPLPRSARSPQQLQHQASIPTSSIYTSIMFAIPDDGPRPQVTRTAGHHGKPIDLTDDDDAMVVDETSREEPGAI